MKVYGLGQRVLIKSLVTVCAVVTCTLAALAAEGIKGPIPLDANFQIKLHCVLVENPITQTAGDVANALGIPLGSVVMQAVALPKGAGRCALVRLDDSGALIGSKTPRFNFKIYDGNGAVLKKRTNGSCFNIVAQPVCVPKAEKGGDAAVGMSACFELTSSETSDHEPISVVLQVGQVPPSVEGDETVSKKSCSNRAY